MASLQCCSQTYRAASNCWNSFRSTGSIYGRWCHCPHTLTAATPTPHTHASHWYTLTTTCTGNYYSRIIFTQAGNYSTGHCSLLTSSDHRHYLTLPYSNTLDSTLSSVRCIHTSSCIAMPDKKATVEKAVDSAKEKKKKPVEIQDNQVSPVKPSLLMRLKDFALHYYHGFRLLALDMRVAFRLLVKTGKGKSLSRREQKQFRRTVGDIFRVVPFSVFVIIPFMEFLLPVYIWLFPNALPSTFQSKSSKEKRKKQELKIKLSMAKFLQSTIEEMAVTSKHPGKNESVQEFAQFFEKISRSGEQASTDEIVRFSKLFEDELTLDSLSRPQLQALCKLLLLQPIGSSNFLRFQLRMKLRQLKADDQLIYNEGVESLDVIELQSASQARGMRALGMPVDRLKSQLQQWLELHLHQEVPASLLLLSRALYLPEDIPTSDALQATLSSLPESIVEEAELLVADSSGETVDNKTRLEVLRQQEELIREEAEEKHREKEELVAAQVAEAKRVSTEELVDTAPLVTPATPPTDSVGISVEELRGLSEAVSSLKADHQLEDERADLEELKEEREEYREDVADLAEACRDELVESKGSARLGRRVESIISTIDQTLQQLEKELVSADTDTRLHRLQQERTDMITCSQLEEALAALKDVSGESKIKRIVEVLDEDHDGNINLRDIAEVIESLAVEDTDIKAEHVAQIKELISKEEGANKQQAARAMNND